MVASPMPSINAELRFQDQWQRKKQTPEQKRAAKKAKLDPDNWKSAKDVMDERQAAINKRKREEEGDISDSPMGDTEKPRADLDSQKPEAKKRKLADSTAEISACEEANAKLQETKEQRIQRKKEQKAEKKQRKKEKKAKLKEKLERQKARKKEAKQQKQPQKEGDSKSESMREVKSRTKANVKGKQPETSEDDGDDEDVAEVIDIDRGTAFAEGAPMDKDHLSSSSSDEETEEVFSPLHDSGVSSNSSIPPPTSDESMHTQPNSLASVQNGETEKNNPPQKVSQPLKSSPTSEEDPKQRLQAAISAFRAERKADSGPKSRSELLEQRRRQEERRRVEKNEQKRREKEEEARKQEEEIAKRFSPGGSGSLLGSPRSPIIDTDTDNFSFGRVAFADGSSLDPANSTATEAQKRKGPSDPATALKAAQAKQQRISGYDAEKRDNIHDKDMWINARKRAAGEKVKDDTSLLKKALKRHEGQKKRSEKEWTERKEGVKKSMHMKQKKRKENLEKRKDEKGQKGKKGKVKRPGFEGSFRGRTGGGKKKA